MHQLIQAAHEVQTFCEERGWPACVIGGLTLSAWAEARLTRDADFCLFTGVGDESRYIDALLTRFAARHDDPKAFALAARVLLLRTRGGVAVDVALGASEYERGVIERAVEVEYLDGLRLRVCTAEDLIVLKAFADRLQDWADVEATVRRRYDVLDWSHITRYLEPLCELKEAPEIVRKLDDIRRLIGRSRSADQGP